MKVAEKPEYTLQELISIFNEEAFRICNNREEAGILALEALTDFINIYRESVTIK